MLYIPQWVKAAVLSYVVTTKLVVPAGALVHDSSGDSFPPGLPSIEQELESFTMMLLIMLMGRVCWLEKVVLLSWKSDCESARAARLPVPCDAAGSESDSTSSIRPPICVFMDVSSLGAQAWCKEAWRKDGSILLRFWLLARVAGHAVTALFWQLFHHLLCLLMPRMLLKQFEQQSASFLRRVFHDVNSRQVQVRLIELRRHADALLKAGHGLIAPLRAQVKDSQIVQRFGVDRTQLQRLLQRIEGSGSVVVLCEHHSQAVIRFRVVGVDLQRALVSFASVIPTFLLAIGAAQVIEHNRMIGTQLERLLKMADRFSHASFAPGQQAEIIPGVCQSVGIAGAQFERAFKARARLCRLLLVQIDASDAIERFGAGRIVAQSNLE